MHPSSRTGEFLDPLPHLPYARYVPRREEAPGPTTTGVIRRDLKRKVILFFDVGAEAIDLEAVARVRVLHFGFVEDEVRAGFALFAGEVAAGEVVFGGASAEGPFGRLVAIGHVGRMVAEVGMVCICVSTGWLVGWLWRKGK